MSTILKLSAAMAITLWAASPVVAKTVKIGWVQGNAAFQAEQRTEDGFKKYLADNKITDWEVTYLDSGGTAEKVANNIEDAVNRGVDVIYVTYADLRASSNALKGAKAAKIPVYSVDSGWIDGSTADITTNNWQMSAEVSLSLINKINGKGNLIIITTDKIKPVRERTDTLRAILKEYPDVKVIGEYNFNVANFYQETTNAVQDFATRFGDKIDAVWTPWDEPAQAAITALKGAGLHVPVSGMDGHPEAIQAICAKDSMFIATGRQLFEKWGADLASYAKRVKIDGEDPQAVTNGKNIVYYGATLFTQDNCK
ncbi:sugar ABC transporter substrate-binding protein [Methylovirgula sp. 4M-Z18]|uniref:sugar ABC transporter substrate-binding protein n=1 Tax=Methylovirgula sp. 4M-Z18 TaxID=2293567 RepID=UPI000E2E83AF|nr:sugar ABC transporter substrate-binding protein [Methylovirgula sp. 4M-Z18]RFB74951.1 sugar ABC transporter substrate-binding protein [Methylovirgula sp. 4M-Z18]